MPIDTIHPEVSCRLEEWQKIRDFVAGAKAVKAKEELYLPKLKKMKPAEYRNFLRRASFLGATGRTAEGLLGLIFRKPPTMELTDNGDIIKQDADMTGKGLVAYARAVTAELATVGRAGTLIDWSVDENRPYMVLYKAEQVINWRVSRLNPDGMGARMILTHLTLKETHIDYSADEFMAVEQEAWRVYRNTGTAVMWGKYIRNKDDKKRFDLIGSGIMTRTGKALPEIPFVFHNADEPGPCPGKAPMTDLVELNHQHYLQSADYNNGLHVAGLPTPFFFGPGATKSDEDGGDDDLFLGPNTSLTSDDPNSSCGFMEFTGQGLGAIKESLTMLEGQMAAVGARLIEPRKADAESADTVGLRQAADSSALARIGQQATEGLQQALAWCEWWAGKAATTTDAANGWTFLLNNDFTSTEIAADMLTAWGGQRSSNLISAETYDYNLRRCGAYPEGWTFEKEQDAIEATPPMPAPIPTDPNKIDPETGLPYEKPVPDPKKPPAK